MRRALSEVGLWSKLVLRLLAQERSPPEDLPGKELEPLALTAPPHTCKDGHLEIGHVALISLGQCLSLGLITGSSLGVRILLFPSQLGIVHLGHDGTDAAEVFLGGIAQGETACETGMHVLRHLGHETHIAHHIAAIDTNGQFIAMVAHLGESR